MRNFPDFLTAYQDYAHDEYCPPQFHLWTGLSVLAGALERKVWTRQSLVTHYPNIYTLLVSHPAVGKSTALERGIDLLEELKRNINQDFKIIPTQATEPALIDLMKIHSSIQLGSTIVQYSSGYFYASEASASALQNVCGDFNAAITAFYDCPRVFRKKLKGDTHSTEILNACFNVLAGTTFDFLKRLVNEESVMGGLASRFIYVICKDRIIREPKWHMELNRDEKMRGMLVADLAEINKMQGPFKPTPGFISAWEKWQPEFDRYLIDLKSPRMESIMARKGTNLLKICMLLSASEGDSYELREDHWERGVKLVEAVTKDNPFIISSAMIANKDTQAGVNQIILQTLKKSGWRMTQAGLKAALSQHGTDSAKIEPTMKLLLDSGQVKLVTVNGKLGIELLVDPDTCL